MSSNESVTRSIQIPANINFHSLLEKARVSSEIDHWNNGVNELEGNAVIKAEDMEFSKKYNAFEILPTVQISVKPETPSPTLLQPSFPNPALSSITSHSVGNGFKILPTATTFSESPATLGRQQRPSSLVGNSTSRTHRMSSAHSTQFEDSLLVQSNSSSRRPKKRGSKKPKVVVDQELDKRIIAERRAKKAVQLDEKHASATATVSTLDLDGNSVVDRFHLTGPGWNGIPLKNSVNTTMNSVGLGRIEMETGGSRFDGKKTLKDLNHLVGATCVPVPAVEGESVRFMSQNEIFGIRVAATPRTVEVLNAVSSAGEAMARLTSQDAKPGSRGAHYSKTAGSNRGQGSTEIAPNAFLIKNRALVEKFTTLSEFQELCTIIERVLDRELPRVAAAMRRMDVCKDAPAYGLYTLFCLNLRGEDGQKVHCNPHTDSENSSSAVCTIIPLGSFDSKKTSWLVLWELGIYVELPYGFMLMFPSSLISHWNVDIYELDPGLSPEDYTKEELASREGTRSSLVFYCQANTYSYVTRGGPLNTVPKGDRTNDEFPRIFKQSSVVESKVDVNGRMSSSKSEVEKREIREVIQSASAALEFESLFLTANSLPAEETIVPLCNETDVVHGRTSSLQSGGKSNRLRETNENTIENLIGYNKA